MLKKNHSQPRFHTAAHIMFSRKLPRDFFRLSSQKDRHDLSLNSRPHERPSDTPLRLPLTPTAKDPLLFTFSQHSSIDSLKNKRTLMEVSPHLKLLNRANVSKWDPKLPVISQIAAKENGNVNWFREIEGKEKLKKIGKISNRVLYLNSGGREQISSVLQ